MSNKKSGSLSARSAILLMAAVSVARGSSFMFSQQLLETIGPLNLLGIRSLIAFAVLMLFFGKRVAVAVSEDHGNLSAGAVLGFAYFIVMVLELNGLKYTTTSTASFIENSAVVLVPLAEAIIGHKVLSGRTVICSVLGLAGIGFIAARGFSHGIGTGEILCTICAFVYTAAIILTDRKARKYDPCVVGILYVGFMGAFAIAGSFITETPHLPQTMNQWLMLMMLAIVCSSFGFAMQPVAQRTISSETTGLMTAINPLTTAILGALILHEPFGVMSMIGAALIISAIIIHNMHKGD